MLYLRCKGQISIMERNPSKMAFAKSLVNILPQISDKTKRREFAPRFVWPAPCLIPPGLVALTLGSWPWTVRRQSSGIRDREFSHANYSFGVWSPVGASYPASLLIWSIAFVCLTSFAFLGRRVSFVGWVEVMGRWVRDDWDGGRVLESTLPRRVTDAEVCSVSLKTTHLPSRLSRLTRLFDHLLMTSPKTLWRYV